MVGRSMAQHLIRKCIFGLIVILMGFLLVFRGSQRKEDEIYSIQTNRKVIALTFDDGPHPIYTPQLLDVLSKYDIKATFFMIGISIKKYPFIVRQVVAKGHAIGNHTYTHPFNLTFCLTAQIIKELKDCQSIIRKVTGQRVFIFRPPRGLFNKEVVQIAKKKGYQTILWSVCGNNQRANNPRLMARYVINNIHSGDIILLHDGTFDSRWKDVEATRLIIEALLRKGFHFVTVPYLLKLAENNI